MPRKLEAQFAGRYLISSVLMTSTMKSEPALPPIRANSFGVPVSAAMVRYDGGSAEGNRDGTLVGAAFAVLRGGVTAVAAPATATPVSPSFRSMSLATAAAWAPAGRR